MAKGRRDTAKLKAKQNNSWSEMIDFFRIDSRITALEADMAEVKDSISLSSFTTPIQGMNVMATRNGNVVTAAGFLMMSAEPWTTTPIVEGLPPAKARAFGSLTLESGTTGAFVPIYGGADAVAVETKGNTISNINVFFGITYIAE